MTTHYPAKILLFGEYTILHGSRALAVPYSRFTGHWAWGAGKQEQLLAFSEFLKKNSTEKYLPPLDTSRFKKELKKGLYFKSDIPIGYGAGSSGALVAAVLDRYAEKAGQERIPLWELQTHLAKMERFFHGSSSGVDPLISYIQKPLLFQSGKIAEPVALPQKEDFKMGMYLLDTGKSRQTEPLVQWYLNQQEVCPSFKINIEEQLLPVTEMAVHNFIQQDEAGLWKAVDAISRFQFKNFERMIPQSLRPAWHRSFDGHDFRIKLCGAGGGGFMLVFAKSVGAIQREFALASLFPVHWTPSD